MKMKASLIQKFEIRHKNEYGHTSMRILEILLDENNLLPYIVVGEDLPIVSHLHVAQMWKYLLPHSATPLHALFSL